MTLKRTAGLRRTGGLKRGGRVKPRNAKRRGKEWARAYGSAERVEFVRSLRCLECGFTPCENAHSITGGAGRKADAETIVPLCGEAGHGCHRKYDTHQPPFDDAERRAEVRAAAYLIARRWEAKCAR